MNTRAFLRFDLPGFAGNLNSANVFAVLRARVSGHLMALGGAARLLLLALLVALSVVVKAEDFNYTTNNGAAPVRAAAETPGRLVQISCGARLISSFPSHRGLLNNASQ